jgi:hypothetical protein
MQCSHDSSSRKVSRGGALLCLPVQLQTIATIRLVLLLPPSPLLLLLLLCMCSIPQWHAGKGAN